MKLAPKSDESQALEQGFLWKKILRIGELRHLPELGNTKTALVNGTACQIKLRAVNSSGRGTESSAVTVRPRPTTVGAPTALVATGSASGSNAEALNAFTAPASDGGATISNYEYSTNGGGTWKAFSPADATTPVVITICSDATTAIVNGTTYAVKLRAVNSSGRRTASTAVTVRLRL